MNEAGWGRHNWLYPRVREALGTPLCCAINLEKFYLKIDETLIFLLKFALRDLKTTKTPKDG